MARARDRHNMLLFCYALILTALCLNLCHINITVSSYIAVAVIERELEGTSHLDDDNFSPIMLFLPLPAIIPKEYMGVPS